MKRTISVLAMSLGVVVAATAQSRSIGARIGITGFAFDYEHDITKNTFVEAEAGIDFGYAANGRAGMKITGIYNWVFARPAWTQRGTWAIYMGPGLSLGYVNDHIQAGGGTNQSPERRHGFMLALAVELGVEYTFDFPFSLSVDLRPLVGMHKPDSAYIAQETGTTTIRREYESSYYNNGWFGFVPSVSMKYRF